MPLACVLAWALGCAAQFAVQRGIAFGGYSCGSLLEPLPGTFRSAESCALEIARSPIRVEHFAWGPVDARCWRCDATEVKGRWPDIFG
eukprot:CAMPEP_0179968320 /NCGR_PEP_ID=MMETSP0983-20121128/33788_1 /TAXON_ID=483367 /ORGANISM="non described non described, Strain CCMP 2436" /LENGTH=87 /DNA_ID=CAMNT_0021882083 /DNA_START=30 /DNA_END=290 /DNA_ORIENTATION=+